MLAAAGSLAGEERQHDAQGAVQAGAGVVGDQVERDHRLAVLLADEVEDAGEREVVHVVRRTVAVAGRPDRSPRASSRRAAG